jgi:hypothetical protein
MRLTGATAFYLAASRAFWVRKCTQSRCRAAIVAATKRANPHRFRAVVGSLFALRQAKQSPLSGLLLGLGTGQQKQRHSSRALRWVGCRFALPSRFLVGGFARPVFGIDMTTPLRSAFLRSTERHQSHGLPTMLLR